MKPSSLLNKNILYSIAEKMVRPLVIPFFWFSRWVMHNNFRRAMNSDIVGRPAFLSLPFVYAYLGLVLLSRGWRRSFDEYALPRYQQFVARHYSKEGLGYRGLSTIDGEQARALYSGERSQLAYYLNHHKKLLTCVNGDSFLDVGCGSGQNIQELSRRFPDSKIHGFDINDDAVSLIKTVEKNPHVVVEVGSFLDPTYLQRYQPASYDWIVLSHVLGFIVANGIEATMRVRKELIVSLARLARKGLIVLDGPPEAGFKVVIEQNTRCIIKFDYTLLFDKSLGELYMLHLENDWAYCLMR